MKPSRSLVILLVLAACKGGESLPEPGILEAVSASNGQVGVAGGPLPEPLRVRVLSDDNRAVPRASVRWTVESGAGAVLSDSVTLSDGNGVAEVALTLGPQPGTYTVRGALVEDPGLRTQLEALATPAPALTGLAPTSFAGGDTVTITGQDLAAVDAVRIGGVLSRVVSANATQLVVIAPICLPAGPVQLQAFRLRGPSNAVQATYLSGGTVSVGVGEWSVIDPSGLPGCVTFPAAGGSDVEYVVTVTSVTGTPGLSASYVFGGDSVVPPPIVAPPSRPPTPAETFHDRLRAWEADAAGLPRPPAAPPSALAAPSIRRPKVGDARDFRVCSTITCNAAEDFTFVRAEARYVGTHAALYVDVEAPSGGFSAGDLDSLGALFDQDLYDVATTSFGAESDEDQNGVVIVLLTPVVNGLTPTSSCGTSIITGFFFGIDIDRAFQGDERSNGGEVFYALAPDPSGATGCPLGLDVVRRLVPVTFVHEFQHMINYHQHVLLRGSPQQEVLWLNEGLSHIAEELAALRFDAQGRDDLFSRFAIGNLFNGFLYLSNPGAYFVLPQGGTGTLEERGAAWLFLRWLGDQFGNDIYRRLVETRRTGSANLEAVVGEPMPRLLPEWFLATWASDLPLFTAPPRLRYHTWRLRSTYDALNEQLPNRFDREFPIQPQLFVGGQFATTGTVRSGSGSYYRIQHAAGQPGFTLRVTGPGGGALDPAVLTRVTVLRVR